MWEFVSPGRYRDHSLSARKLVEVTLTSSLDGVLHTKAVFDSLETQQMMDGWTDRQMDKWMGGWVVRWVNKWVGGWMGG